MVSTNHFQSENIERKMIELFQSDSIWFSNIVLPIDGTATASTH